MEKEIIEGMQACLRLWKFILRVEKELFFQRKVFVFLEKEEKMATSCDEAKCDAAIDLYDMEICWINDMVRLADTVISALDRKEFVRAHVSLQKFISNLEKTKTPKEYFFLSLKVSEIYLRKVIIPSAEA